MCKGLKCLQTPVRFPVSSYSLLPLVLQEQKCVPASGELSPELQEWSPYSPGHSSRHSNPPLYPNRASVGESAGQGWEEEGHCGPTGLPSPRASGGSGFKEELCVFSPEVQEPVMAALSKVMVVLSQ